MRYYRLAKYLLLAGLMAFLVETLLNIVYDSEEKRIGRHTPIAEDLYKVVSPSTYEYILNQPIACEHNPDLVLMVPVAPGDSGSRDAVRNSWGQRDLVSNVKMVKLFFVGVLKGEEGENAINALAEENLKHADIILMDFLDSYHNLTVKTMMMMNWLVTYCQSASYVMKIDADIFLNVYYLINMLPFPAKKNYIIGSVINDGMPRRDEKSKWYLSKDIYPDTSFPPYVSGAGYVFSADLAAKISMASRFVRPIPLEDVYVGLCLNILGVRPVYGRSMFWLRNLFEVHHLDYDRCTFAKLVLVVDFPPSELLKNWPDFQKNNGTC
ncbi:beta-1,3-galactosyltransferase 2 [Alosa alosa]|uniref:beta-1,3-galactosyltransferase 2 n=1 Tax=Alosa alosa TaxID=278164 RepID=UPI0020153432|nr:beta-1,3-galactosyltransferase 2 [Alosa alosa]